MFIRLGLWLLPFHWLQPLLPIRQNSSSSCVPVPDLIRSILWAKRRVPQATCLTQALTGQVLLAQKGYASRLWLGVTKDPKGKLMAHAWLEHENSVILGESVQDAHIPLVCYPPLF